jgi:hypothetical protein
MVELVLALAAGIALSAACGLRAFLPVFGVGLAARLGWIPLAPGAEWLADDRTLIALGVATLVEILADKIPIVDHGLDVVATVLRPAAAAVGTFALLTPLPEPWGKIAAILFAGGALAIHAAKAKTRVGSTALTFGLANPVLSFLEDGLSFAIAAAAILIPLLALFLVLVLFWLVRKVFFPRPKASASPSG